jgi:hypothetical protein
MLDLEPQIDNHPDGPPLSTLSLPYFIDLTRWRKAAVDDE